MIEAKQMKIPEIPKDKVTQMNQDMMKSLDKRILINPPVAVQNEVQRKNRPNSAVVNKYKPKKKEESPPE